MAKFLRRALGGKDRQPADLITGLIGPEKKKGGWSVSWVTDGAAPPSLHAPTLTQAADQAAAAVAALYAAAPPIPDAELQLAICPWNYRDGPMFDIDGHPGSLTAHDIQGSDLTVNGATLEDLVAAVEHMPDIPSDDSMFRWVRQITSLRGTSQ
jgi:hypothetical protein